MSQSATGVSKPPAKKSLADVIQPFVIGTLQPM